MPLTTCANGITNSERPAFEQHTVTRDAQIPIFEGDTNFDHGWHCVPQRPKPRPDDDMWSPWEPCNCCNRDYKSGWKRYRRFRFLKGWLSTVAEVHDA
jgi:hypothetical protein